MIIGPKGKSKFHVKFEKNNNVGKNSAKNIDVI